MKLARLVAVWALLVVAVDPVKSAQEPGRARENIVYSSIQPANWDLYLFDGPGSEPRRLTTDPGLDYNGVISPDGRWVVFTSERTGSPDLFVLDLHGDAAPRSLVEGPAMEDAAAISPDGRRLLFVSTRDGNADVFEVPFRPEDPAAAGEARNLTRHPSGDYNPAFSPDGTRILFSSSRDTAVATSSGASPGPTYLASELYVMRADGTDVRRLTRHESWDGAPAWTPDGEGVFFYSQRDGEPRIYRTGVDRIAGAETVATAGAETFATAGAETVAIAGAETVAIAGAETVAIAGAETVAIAGASGGAETVASGAEIAGPGPEPISAPNEAALSPTFAPDGRLAYTAQRDGRWTLVSTRPDGSDPRVESDAARDYWAPAFDPASGRLLAHGPGPVEDASVFESDAPGAFLVHPPLPVDMPDRQVSLVGIRGYLPAVDPTSLRDGNFELYTVVVDEDGRAGPPERLTTSPGHDLHPRFSPDDEWVLFTSQRAELGDELPLLRVVFQPQPYGELHAIRLSDRTVVRLTHNKWEDGPTAWVRDVPGFD